MIFFGGFLEDDGWKPPIEPMGFLRWLVVFFILLWFAWFFTGGPERYEDRVAPFLKPPAPLDTGEQYGIDGLKTGVLKEVLPDVFIRFEKVERPNYTFESPSSWIKSDPMSFDGCIWDGISNDSSDGHRMAGEIGIYQSSCFNLNNANGRKDVELKDGYFIISYYDEETTTKQEIEETKLVFKRVSETFKAK